MKVEWKELYKNNSHVDERLLESLSQLNSVNIKSSDVKSAGYAINHPLDSSMFREAIKDSIRKPSSEYIATAVNSIRY